MKRLPLLAIIMGIASLLPIVGCTCAIIFLSPAVTPRMLEVTVGYGAVMLSFMGAVHWGLALETPAIITPGQETGKISTYRLLLGGVPAGIGWLSLCAAMFHELAAVLMLMAGFAGVVVVERMAWRRGAMPRGYMTLQWIVMTVVEVCLLAVTVMALSWKYSA
ncbi:DUF3429 domain-containing protein [Gluconacetobacter entanii]|uniref:DUF3429 domain-containing protein n=1 Tax=Gluconacetobacter entanii TaxID=108528 RepID=UPI001C932848|nr:DUF3429 domain-containing protein [Gluconacetobacter entanii]MBY4641202.1 DUF3429 domain-containing protein [Gluconacetobacter entanii]MCW4581046.1 DUF3429 domain-containing protein [Gluconacetobacter entanii]MCW4584285.1 DUF3429 domain-containing protein [Gluconacetobacter entanii]MCW4587699.1 DUF3429 domain-containing protein [Gluconacetobacter entanii]